MSQTFDPIPTGDAIATKQGAIGDAWTRWLQKLVDRVMRAPYRMEPTINLTAQGASIATASLPLVQYSGLYRLTYYLRITRAATTSSSVTVTFSWTDAGVVMSTSGAAITGNTTTTFQTGTYLMYIDGGTTPTYSTSYASVGGTSAQYKIAVVLEMINA